jgi:hypothetical protein
MMRWKHFDKDYFLLGNGTISQNRKKQTCIVMSSIKKWVYGIFPSYNANIMAFIKFLDVWYVHRWNPLLCTMTIKAIYLYHKTQLFMYAWNISRFIIIWCDTKLILLSWCIATQKILLQMYWPRLFYWQTWRFPMLDGVIKHVIY